MNTSHQRPGTSTGSFDPTADYCPDATSRKSFPDFILACPISDDPRDRMRADLIAALQEFIVAREFPQVTTYKQFFGFLRATSGGPQNQFLRNAKALWKAYEKWSRS